MINIDYIPKATYTILKVGEHGGLEPGAPGSAGNVPMPMEDKYLQLGDSSGEGSFWLACDFGVFPEKPAKYKKVLLSIGESSVVVDYRSDILTSIFCAPPLRHFH
ncbi:MAG: hypothetical protein IH588_09520 [Anaerolineales bacterium]|nr:hypothetical protein [Anaerolineales bacterium]